MKTEKLRETEYCIFDPTGNITALVESQVAVEEQPELAAAIMERHPEVEQVGFVGFADDGFADDGSAGGAVPVSLRMAGGEFCGNATMCAAALYALRKGLNGSATVRVKVSGAPEALDVGLEKTGESSFAAAVSMPKALSIDELNLANGMLSDDSALRLPVVRMGGIDHIIIMPEAGLPGLKDDKALGESLIRGWCAALGSDCLGMMFLGENVEDRGGKGATGYAEKRGSGDESGPVQSRRTLTPLVYVPGADTMFWENSCASGSAAAGIYLAAEAGTSVDATFEEPAGQLRVESDPATGVTVLHGSTHLIQLR